MEIFKNEDIPRSLSYKFSISSLHNLHLFNIADLD